MKVVNDPITLSDLTLSANVQVEVGSSVVVSGFHPVSEEYVVARGEVIPSWLCTHQQYRCDGGIGRKVCYAHERDGEENIKSVYVQSVSQVDQNFSEED